MLFKVIESTYRSQGTANAFAVTDSNGRTYYIPRSQVNIVERQDPESDYDVAHLTIDVKDWVINRNRIPVFKITELSLVR